MKLEGKIALVTGAAQGMGRAIVRHFAEQGATVYAADINVQALEETVSGLAERGRVQHCNVADEQSVLDAFARIAAESGRLDILVNNAGIGSHDSFLDTPLEHWNRVIGVNLTGAFLCSREAARLMSQAGSGAIVNLASTAAMTGEGPSHYCASKAAIMGLTRSTARELAASGIRVNTLDPLRMDGRDGQGHPARAPLPAGGNRSRRGVPRRRRRHLHHRTERCRQRRHGLHLRSCT